MRTYQRVALLLLGPVTFAACAECVRVLANGGAIQLDPATVRVGDNIYLVLEPPTDHVVFIEGKPTAEAVPGPLTDADIARLATGDLQGTSLPGFEMTGCGGDALQADPGQLRV